MKGPAPWLGAALLGVLLATWLLSLLIGYDVVADVDPAAGGRGPGAGHWLGTDHMGRDVFWRMLTATEAFVGPAFAACGLTLLVGIPAGALAGYLGGPVAATTRYTFSVVGAIPRFVLVLMAAAIYGSETSVLAVVAGLAYAPTLGDAVLGRIEQLRRADFVEAARAHGFSTREILGRQLLWSNCRRLVARHALHLFGYFLLLETTLSYLGGFGVEEPQPSWGNMLAFEFGIVGGNTWAWAAPSIAIWLTLLATFALAQAFGEQQRG